MTSLRTTRPLPAATMALDVMGGDDAPEIVIEGAALALRRQPELRFLLFGDERIVGPLLKAQPALVNASAIRHTESAVAGDDKPSVALRQGRQSSMRLAINAVKDGDAAAAVSAGNTGALMAMAKFVLKTLPGVARPAIAGLMPTRRGASVALDLGANAQCDAEQLFQFAVMGDVFARVVLDLDRPTIGLINIGAEEMKGDDVVREAAALIRGSSLPLRFEGFVEGSDVMAGAVDVVVTDGFTGNVALKIVEGAARLFSSYLKEALTSDLRAKIGARIAKPALLRFRDRMDPRHYNGGMFLGLNGVVVKSHGGADGVGFAAAVDMAHALIAEGVNQRIIEEMNTAENGQPALAQAAAH